jgi:hypothetical protein
MADAGNMMYFVVIFILTMSVVIPQVLNANLTGLSSNDQNLVKTIATIVVVGLLVTAARMFGLLEYLAEKRALKRT